MAQFRDIFIDGTKCLLHCSKSVLRIQYLLPNKTDYSQLDILTSALLRVERLTDEDMTIQYCDQYKQNYLKLCKSTISVPNECDYIKLFQNLDRSVFENLQYRPKHSLFVLNPFGGRKLAQRIFTQQIEPIFRSFDVTFDTFTTDKPKHALEHIMQNDLTKYDSVIAVGGDGIINEIVEGLLLKERIARGAGVQHMPDSQEYSPKLTLGIIPAGSTDSICYSVHGNNDVVTAALRILLGRSIGLDVVSVYAYPKMTFMSYCLSLLGYGFHGDIIKMSDGLRWMGPTRYDLSGFLSVMSNKSYFGELIMVLDEQCPAKNDPRLCVRCEENCSTCIKEPSDQGHNFAGALMTDEDPSLWNKSGITKKIVGRFLAINAFNIACLCEKAPFGAAPTAHLGNGSLDLVVIHQCSRLSFLKKLILLKTPSSASLFNINSPVIKSEDTDLITSHSVNSLLIPHYDLPYVEAFRVKAFRFIPYPSDPREHQKFMEAVNQESKNACCACIFKKSIAKSDYTGLANQTSSNSDLLERVLPSNFGLARENQSQTGLVNSFSIETSVWSADGEMHTQPGVIAIVHRQLIKIYGIGPRPKSNLDA